MGAFSPFYYFAGMALLFALAATPALRLADDPAAGAARVSTLDGLRGFLALAVVFHHAAIYRQFIADGRWVAPPSSFYVLLGQVGVSLFFMVTGYLFWTKCIRARGLPPWRSLYIGRLFRIGPLYGVAIAAMLAIVFARTGLTLREPGPALIRHILDWSLLGYRFGPDVNGYSQTFTILAGVTWTLHYEWLFYASLILTALFARSLRTHLVLPLLGLVIGVALTFAGRGGVHSPAPDPVILALFSAGMLAASLQQAELIPPLGDGLASVLALGLLAALFTTASSAYAGTPIVLMALIFVLVSNGCSLFGLFHSRPAQRLGAISYGVYLLQGLPLALLFASPWARGQALASGLAHWEISWLAAALLVLAATLAHAAIERPGIALGRRIAVWAEPATRPRSEGRAMPQPPG